MDDCELLDDRELLEMAAKVAGVKGLFRSHMTGRWLTDEDVGHEYPERREWNPLDDDGDALRLAVTLMIGLGPRRKTVTAIQWAHVDSPPCAMEFYEEHPDPCAATRRAIVRAAAEIGRTR